MSELSRGTARFEAVGKLKLNKKSFKIDVKSSKKWVYSNMFFILNCNNTEFTTSILAGYNPDEPKNIEYSEFGGYIKGVKDEKGKMKTDFKSRLSIDWEDRLDEEVLKDISSMDKIRVQLSEDLDKVEFITYYDVIDYLKENAKDGMHLKIFGDIAYEYDKQENLVKNYLIKGIYYTTIDEDNQAYFTCQETVLVNKDSTDKSVDEQGYVHINGYIPTYIRTKGEDYINTIVGVPASFIIDTEKTPKYEIYLKKFFNASDKKFTEITIEYNVQNTGNVRSLTIDDIMNDDNRDFIETEQLLGKTDEEILEGLFGNNRNVVSDGEKQSLKVFKDICTTAKYVDGKLVTKHRFELDKYKDSEVMFVEDFEGKRKPDKSNKQKVKKTVKIVEKEVEQEVESDNIEDDFDELFSGLE